MAETAFQHDAFQLDAFQIYIRGEAPNDIIMSPAEFTVTTGGAFDTGIKYMIRRHIVRRRVRVHVYSPVWGIKEPP